MDLNAQKLNEMGMSTLIDIRRISLFRITYHCDTSLLFAAINSTKWQKWKVDESEAHQMQFTRKNANESANSLRHMKCVMTITKHVTIWNVWNDSLFV